MSFSEVKSISEYLALFDDNPNLKNSLYRGQSKIDAASRSTIRVELETYGVFDKQLFPDLDGLAKWLKFKVFEA